MGWGNLGTPCRINRSVKSSLKKSISTRCLTKSELITLLCEIETCINSRPLTFVGDTLDSWEALTPNHFLTGGNMDAMILNVSPASVTANDLRHMAASRSEELQKFWTIWRQSYIRELPHAPMAKARRSLKLDDVVIIREDNCPKLYWPLGRVTKLIPSKDKLIRTVEVKTRKGLFVRPIQRLHLLELEGRGPMSDGTEADSQGPDSSDDTAGIRTRTGRCVKPTRKLSL